MSEQAIKRVVVAGGGTAGWMTACALVSQLGHYLDVVLVESEDIPTVGVGEATIPTMQSFHLLLQLQEQEFMRETNATFKLGIEFANWGRQGHSYFHSFGETGKEFWAGQFQHFWLRECQSGGQYSYADYSPETQAAKAGKFAITKNPRLGFAYHLDAGLYAKYLRRVSESRGVTRIEGKIDAVQLNPQSGAIDALQMADGQKIAGDLFVDCTGFRGLLIERALHAGYDDWSHYFLCDSAVAVQTSSAENLTPYTRSIARESGWQWRIPLQNRVGNGFVYASGAIDDDRATQTLLDNVSGDTLTDAKLIKFRPGKRRRSWVKNCVALGLASGFIEPLESTSIHLVSSAVIRLMRMLPLGQFRDCDIQEFNRATDCELASVRDFVLLHYKQTEREDSDFWRYCRSMDVPESLQTRLDIYRDSGRIYWQPDELFTVNSWNQVMLGQGVMPRHYHPAADIMSESQFVTQMTQLREGIDAMVKKMPSHGEFIRAYCQR
ncbi:tryptophan halogenase family protein [Gilvimarinus xylanilyticus]|uniref:Tryptophan 7-halogenase n=1 Tax=Gilvimarinus xylanilyticus TaxID=2944139 RepID=A0A9X2I267_9GAMM|nr:tryptophan halogenase family protein [Gilvimarinus xylanilyticus]MCP8898147.1 tryptophan 7-halogenase [Gilvimarinus xylanilyticus]